MYFNNSECNFKVETRELEYGDYRDWFLIKKSKIKAHKTKLIVYLNDEKISDILIPINFKKIDCDIKTKCIKDVTICYFKWIIPEMGFKKISHMASLHMLSKNTLEMNCNLTMECD